MLLARSTSPSINSAFDTAVKLDNLNVRVHLVSGSAGQVQISPVSGSFTAYVTIEDNVAGNAIKGDTNASGIAMSAGTWYSINATYNISSGGDLITFVLMDITNSRVYRVTAMHGNNSTGAFIAIERLL